MRARGENGYALVAAVASILVFSMMALTVLSAARGAIVTGSAEIEAAKVGAAADSGIEIALQGLLTPDLGRRWSIDSVTRTTRFDDATLAIRIEDERGKVPINRLDPEYATALLSAAGLDGQRLKVAAASLVDWTDDDDDAEADGAETPYYAPLGIAPRNGAMLSFSELALVRGFDPALVDRLRSFATIYSGNRGFDPKYAQPLAIAVMMQSGVNGADVIQRQHELAGQRTAIELGTEASLVGRALTIRVDARLAGGAHARRTAVVELTGVPVRPFVIRSYE